ncbi:hypothetical protein [Nocardioides sp. zg-1228]|uniref:hypothetical protein n=1 Tax=Nocardioides sp. zg-1228 TaxID=2763008 RepID=UPI00164309F9|nr:hypothetical protein [Nocardioides sp. zg-1228]MBC2932295.1 hypothetical protein [Nocardioides sp. zg-1228]QSF57816.1 hypothetical protein JX575_00820 [Nocardioides sp. zg-1228]
MEISDWLRVGLLVVLVVVLALRARSWLRHYRRGGAGDRELVEKAHATQESVVRLAADRGWTVRRGPAAAGAFPADLRAHAIDVGECDLDVTGEGFRSRSWTAYTSRRGSGMKYAIRVHVTQVEAPGVEADLVVRDLPVVWTPLLFPDRFHGRASDAGPQRVLAAGDVAATRERLAPLMQRIVDSGVWVVVSGGVVTVMAHWEPDADELERWLGLARDVASALS